MRLLIFFITATFLLQSPIVSGSDPCGMAISEVQPILDKLYLALGDKRIECPSLEISDSEEFVAMYSPGSHKIVLEQKTLDLCSAFGDNKEDALAFIIGHELAHAFQGHLDHSDETSFLAYNKAYSPEMKLKVDVKLKETEADIFGSFGAYLAGYKIQNVFPDLINSIYASYGLTDKILPQYPTKSFRNKSAKNMMTKLDSLVKLYDLGNYLSLTGHYTEASACYNYVGHSYKGIELVNNQGVNNLLEALNLSKLNAEPYYYPVELDLKSRLHKAKKTADTKDLNPSEKMLFNLLIIDAIQYFEEAISMDENYLPAYINIICSHAVNNQPEEAINFIQKTNLEDKIYKQGNSDLRASYEIAKAICLLKNGKETEGTKLLKALKSTSNENISYLAKVNLETNDNQQITSESGPAVSKKKLSSKYLNSKPTKVHEIIINQKDKIKLSYWNKSGSTIFHIIGPEDLVIVSAAKSLNLTLDVDPQFVNKDLKVKKDHSVSLISYESSEKEVMVIGL